MILIDKLPALSDSDDPFVRVRTAPRHVDTNGWHRTLNESYRGELESDVIDAMLEIDLDTILAVGGLQGILNTAELAAARISRASGEYGVPADFDAARVAVEEAYLVLGYADGLQGETLDKKSIIDLTTRAAAVGYQNVSSIAA